MKTKLKKLLPDWSHYGDESLIEYAPVSAANILKSELEFFNLGKYISDDGLENEYEQRGLVPAHPLEIAEYVKANPDFKEKYIGTHWKDDDGNWCFAAFDRWDDVRSVDVGRNDYGWLSRWWLSGVRKSSELETNTSSDPQSLELRLQKLENWFRQHNIPL